MVYTLRFFFSSKCSLFHNSNVFGSCIIHILCTECAKIKKKSGTKRLMAANEFWFRLCSKELRNAEWGSGTGHSGNAVPLLMLSPAVTDFGGQSPPTC